jgi:hypothetical protein
MDPSTHPAPAKTWRSEKQGGPEYAPPRRNTARRVFIAVAGVLGLVGLVAGLLSWLAPLPRPKFVALWVNEHQDRALPTPAQGRQDKQAILQSGLFANIVQPPGAGPERHMLLRELHALADHPVLEPFVVYLSTNACRDAKGAVTLFAGNSDPNDPKSRIALKEVLQAVAASPARHRLLVLDIMRPMADARLGALADDVSGAIESELAAVDDADFLVLCSCSAGQTSLASEVAGRSIFNLYFEEGLRGWADGFGATGTRDRRVTVQELAAFVQARVDRWAQQNRGVRQTPVLYGNAADFGLVAIDPHASPGHVAESQAAAYPPWLKDAWKARDQALADGTWRLTPRNFHQQNAWLVKAERDWRGGAEPAQIQLTHLAQVQQLQALAAKTRVLAMPEPQSLALALAFGEKDDKAVTKALQDFLAKLRTMKPDSSARGQFYDDFASKFEKVPALARTSAVLQQAIQEAKPTRDRLEMLVSLMESETDQRPRYVETLVLKRLVEVGPQRDFKVWPTEVVRRLLQVTMRGEAVTSLYEVHSWNAPLLEEADQLRHDGEVAFWARGFAQMADADELLTKAETKYALAGRRADIVLKARAALDDALLLLPDYLPYLDHAPANMKRWLDAVEAARRLDGLVNDPHDNGLRPIDGIQDQTELLQQNLATLRQPFAADALGTLVRRSKLPKADPAVVQEIHALLATPFLKADDRAALRQAGFDVEKRLHDQTIRTDRVEDDSGDVKQPSEPPNTQRDAQEEKQRAEMRATASAALLDLAGLPTAQQQKLSVLLDAAKKKRLDPASLGALGEALAVAWAKQLPNLLREETSLAKQDRLSRLLPALETVPWVDDMPLSLPVQLRQREARGLWARLGERYRYQSRDYHGAGLDWSPLSSGERFYGQAALAYLPAAVEQPPVALTGADEVVRLSANRLKSDATLKLEWTAPKAGKDTLGVRVRSGDPAWLTVDPSETAVQGTALDPVLPRQLTGNLLLDLQYLPGDGGLRGPVPRGVLVQADQGGKHYHFKVKVPIQTAPEQPYLLLSTNSRKPDPVLNEIRLRPGKARQSVYLFARNPSETVRKVTIEIKAGASAFKGGTFTVELPPQSTQRLNLGEPAELPKGDLPDFTGPLQWRVLDPAAKNEVLDEQSIPVFVGSPRDYVRVTNILFTPPGPKSKDNRLTATVNVYSPPGGPDIPVELVLPPDRIPGLVAAASGTFRGTLDANGDKEGSTLLLEGDKIMLADGEDEEGIVYLNVDGYDRAFIFRTTFARRGEPTTPRAEFRPGLRVRADKYLRANAKFLLPVEVDNAPEGATLEISVGQRVAGDFKANIAAKVFPSPRRERIGFVPQSPDGGLVFEGSLQDWQLPVDTSRLLGKHDILLRLLDRNGKEIAKALQTIVVGDSAPEGAQILNAPKAAKRGSKVILQAKASDLETGIKEAQFFVGKPVDNKVPPGATTFKTVPTDKAGSTWKAEVTLPEDKKGPTEVTVQFTNQVGLSTFATATIDLMDTDPAKTGPGRIKGKVVLGELGQPGLEVSLRGDKGAEIAKTKTRADGTFVFEGVAPGKYTLYCRNNAAQRHGTANAVVEANKDTEVTVSLTLRVTK